jgi:hypothetical protein
VSWPESFLQRLEEPWPDKAAVQILSNPYAIICSRNERKETAGFYGDISHSMIVALRL